MKFYAILVLLFSLGNAAAQNYNGPVGIGTTSPAQMLHVNGAAQASHFIGEGITLIANDGFTYNNNGTSIFVDNYGLKWGADPWTGNPNVGNVFGPTARLSAFGGIKFFTLNSFRMGLDVHGRLGIGTQAPTTPLEIAYASNSYELGMNVYNTLAGSASLCGYSVSNAGNNRKGQFIYIPPAYGNPDMQNTVQLSSIGNTPISIVAAADQSGTPDIYFQSGANAHAVHIVGSTGNVGIGTINPGTYRLAVNGDLAARRVRVTQGNGNIWPDYVFEPGYKLHDLDSLESFIKQNKHLPEVVSAEEVGKDGLDVGDTQALMLKKIEELTLYILQLRKDYNEKFDKQQLRIEELTKQVQAK